MNSTISIGVVAPISWDKPGKICSGNDYIQHLENLSFHNPDLFFYILKLDTLENNSVQYYDIKMSRIGLTSIKSFSIIHFLDFEQYDTHYETLKEKWGRILALINNPEFQNTLTINSIRAINYCHEKKYLIEFKNINVQFIQTDIIESCTHLESLQNKYQDGQFIIKPMNGECGSHVYELSKIDPIDYEILSEQDEFFLVQPFHKEITQGEFSMLFFRDEFCHGIVKTPKDKGNLLPPKFDIKPYHPSNDEINVGKIIYSSFPVKLDIFRVDFIKTESGLKLMEIESVDPFHYVIADFKDYAHKLGGYFRMLLN